jgi:hypothetical protein
VVYRYNVSFRDAGNQNHSSHRDDPTDQFFCRHSLLEYQWRQQQNNNRLHVVAQRRDRDSRKIIGFKKHNPLTAQQHAGQDKPNEMPHAATAEDMTASQPYK